MSESAFAREQLHVIRRLMERATLYRSISAPTASVGGLLSLGGFMVAYLAKHHRHRALAPEEFLAVWLLVLALTGATNAFFLWRGAAARDESFLSSGMKCAALSLAPPFFSAGVLTLLFHGSPIHCALAWITLYGMGLLATQHFAPRSLVVLGVLFLAVGLALIATWKHLFVTVSHVEPSALVVSGIMAATFGGLHLAYAAIVWALREDHVEPPSTEPGNV